jgi:hypothetical protein
MSTENVVVDGECQGSAERRPTARTIRLPVERGEPYCFRGSVDDWIGLGPPAKLPAPLKKHAGRLGKDSIYELY